MDKNAIEEKVREVIAAPSCCAELKQASEEWLKAIGTDKEKEAAKNLIAELEDDVQDIDTVLGFFSSPAGAEYFGAEKAKELAALAKKTKDAGGKYCFCPACTAGKAVLDHKELLLG